jgi:hypothetical protein
MKTSQHLILHGACPGLISGPYAVYYVSRHYENGVFVDQKVHSSVTGILTPRACDIRALEYSAHFDAPLAGPLLVTDFVTH